MVIASRPMTAPEFAAMEQGNSFDELMRGALIQVPLPGDAPCAPANGHGVLLADHFEARRLGTVTSGSGIWIQTNPDTLLAPDVALFLGHPAAAVDETAGYDRRIPALVVEIISPSDSFSVVEDKIMTYLNAGVPAVAALDPRRKTLSIYDQARNVRTLAESMIWSDAALLPNFTLPIARLFD